MNFIDSFFFRKIPNYKISWKSVQWEPSCSMRTDGRTDSPVLRKYEFYRQFFFRKIPNYKISWKSVQWEPSCSMRTASGTGQPGLQTRLTSTRSCNYSCASSWWWVSTPETCRAAYRNIINWIHSHLFGKLLNLSFPYFKFENTFFSSRWRTMLHVSASWASTAFSGKSLV